VMIPALSLILPFRFLNLPFAWSFVLSFMASPGCWPSMR
jgi:hypothetical protein